MALPACLRIKGGGPLTILGAMATRPAPQKRPSGLLVVLAFGGAIAVAAALVVVALVARGATDAPDAVTAPVVSLDGIPQQGAVLGNPSAGVTLIEYADVQCPACRFYALEMFPAIVNEYIRPGKVKTEFRGFPFIGPDSLKGQRFLLAAARQDRLWQLAEALYRYQGAENSGWLTDDLIREQAAGIPGLDVDQLFADAARDDIAAAAEQALATGNEIGLPGTPTFLVRIGNEDPYLIQVGSLADLRAALDDALEG
jgi:protein-disulfide isomerase